MLAKKMKLPNVRRLFVPDPGYLIADCDLAGADAQVVAWDAGDEDLKKAFRSGLSVHLKNARDVFRDQLTGWSDAEIKASPYYLTIKKAVHGTNYGGTPRGMHSRVGVTLAEMQAFQDTWFSLHPDIKEWQNRIDYQLQTTRTIKNAFGYRRIFFDRVEKLLPEALAWTPQSTVALTTFLGAQRLTEQCPWCELLMQVHDSLVFQYPIKYHTTECLAEIKKALHVPIPYDDPLIIP